MVSAMNPSTTTPITRPDIVAGERDFLRQTFAWMFLGLALTTGVAIYLHNTGDLLGFFEDHSAAWIGLIIVQFGVVIGLGFLLNRISAQVAAILFALYAGLTGVTFGVILEVYTSGSVIGATAGAAGVFAGMAAYGYTTQRDLSGWGGILFGALIGIIIASIVFAFIGGSTLNLIIGWGGVIIFSGLTAYDMQKLKQMRAQRFDSADQAQKLAIFGALMLYLDFINLVISLLRIFGNAR
jgi:FtsH-binding integral membrane protein